MKDMLSAFKGLLVIDKTEALTAIDVNQAGAGRKKTLRRRPSNNLEAADEVLGSFGSGT